MTKNFASRLGFWAASYVAVLEILYILILIFMMVSEGITLPPSPFVQLASGIATFLTIPGLVVLYTAIRFVKQDTNEVLGSLGVTFTILFAVTVSINRFVQLTVIQSNLADLPADLSRFLPYSEGSIMFSLEVLGWGVFSSIAAVFVAPLFSITRLERTIRWLFIIYALLSFGSAISFVFNLFIPTGPIAWGPIALAMCICLMIYFRNQSVMSVNG